MLSKVWNNSTTRSNVAFVFVQVDFFVVAGTTGRIGGRLTDMPTHRGFMVVDRSKAFELLKAGDFPNDANARFTFRGLNEGGFDFRDLILYREVIE